MMLLTQQNQKGIKLMLKQILIINVFFFFNGLTIHYSNKKSDIISISVKLGNPSCFAKRRRRSKSYKAYRTLYRALRKNYWKANKKWYRTPCHAFFRAQNYLKWLKRKTSSLDNQHFSRYQKRRINRRARYYKKYAKKRLKKYTRYCKRYWKKELKRRPSSLRKSCRYLEQKKGKHHYLRFGVRPWAYVYINKKLCGTAPLTAHLPEGVYEIRLVYPPSKDSYKTTVELYRQDALVFRFMEKTPNPSKKLGGLLSSEQLQWVIKRNLNSMRSCSIYEMKVKRILFSWDVNQKGVPQNIHYIQPMKTSKRFRDCVTRALSRWRFPKLTGIAKIKSYPIHLSQ